MLEGTTNPAIDRLGSWLAVACGVHCLLVPVVVVVAPALGSVFADPWVHRAALLFAVPVSGFALARGRRDHGDAAPLRLGVVGLAALVAAVVFADLGGPFVEIGLSLTGSALVVMSHAWNIRACRASCAPGVA